MPSTPSPQRPHWSRRRRDRLHHDLVNCEIDIEIYAVTKRKLNGCECSQAQRSPLLQAVVPYTPVAQTRVVVRCSRTSKPPTPCRSPRILRQALRPQTQPHDPHRVVSIIPIAMNNASLPHDALAAPVISSKSSAPSPIDRPHALSILARTRQLLRPPSSRPCAAAISMHRTQPYSNRKQKLASDRAAHRTKSALSRRPVTPT